MGAKRPPSFFAIRIGVFWQLLPLSLVRLVWLNFYLFGFLRFAIFKWLSETYRLCLEARD